MFWPSLFVSPMMVPTIDLLLDFSGVFFYFLFILNNLKCYRNAT